VRYFLKPNKGVSYMGLFMQFCQTTKQEKYWKKYKTATARKLIVHKR